MIGTPAAGGIVLEVSTLIAMLVYGLIAWAVERIIFVIFYRRADPDEIYEPTTWDTTETVYNCSKLGEVTSDLNLLRRLIDQSLQPQNSATEK